MKYDHIEVSNENSYLELMRHFADTVWEEQKDFDCMSLLDGAKIDTSGFNSTTTLVFPFGKIQYGYVIQALAELYKHGQGELYAERALIFIRRILDVFDRLIAEIHPSEYDLDTLQLVENGFAAPPFLKGIMILRERGLIDDATHARLQTLFESTVRFLMRIPEWGPFNRCALRFVTFNRFAKLFPSSRYAPEARMMGDFMATDSLGRWHIEDTPTYNGIWYTCVTEYMLENNVEDFRADAVLRYYASYITHIQTPEGSIPEYGDAPTRDFNGIALYLGFLEWMAAKNNDGQVKYCVMKLLDWGKKMYHGNPPGSAVRSWAVAADITAASRVKPVRPVYKSGEVIEDLIGKKIVFRGKQESYLLLNYRDEGQYAPVERRQMYCTIPAPAEKIHHGHADENAIDCLMVRGKYLLADGGYRDKIAVDGHYRADFYHNRVVMRHGRMFGEKGFLQYAENIGTYLKTTTEKLFYKEMQGLEVSRTRVYDEHHTAVADRTVCHFTEAGLYAVIDTVRAEKTYEYTLGQMWFGGKITQNNEHDYVVEQTLDRLKGPRGTAGLKLRVGFVRRDLPVSVEKLRRNSDDNQYALSQYFSEFLGEGEYVHFVTLLCPEEDAATKAVNDAVIASADCRQVSGGKSLMLRLTVGGKRYTLGMKMDEKFGSENYQKRPTYSFEAGKSVYDDFTTDALFSVFMDSGAQINYSALVTSRVDYRDKTVFAAQPTLFANNDLSNNPGSINYVRWDGTIQK